MCDNIIIRKKWTDTDFYEIEITLVTSFITLTTNVYVSDQLINQLIDQIQRAITCGNEEFWINEEPGNETSTSISFRILSTDRAGHYRIEVFAEIGDGGDPLVHNCCFFLNTEYGALSKFSKKLAYLNSALVGFEICLVS